MKDKARQRVRPALQLCFGTVAIAFICHFDQDYTVQSKEAGDHCNAASVRTIGFESFSIFILDC